jgi:hypothetical protein
MSVIPGWSAPQTGKLTSVAANGAVKVLAAVVLDIGYGYKELRSILEDVTSDLLEHRGTASRWHSIQLINVFNSFRTHATLCLYLHAACFLVTARTLSARFGGPLFSIGII